MIDAKITIKSFYIYYERGLSMTVNGHIYGRRQNNTQFFQGNFRLSLGDKNVLEFLDATQIDIPNEVRSLVATDIKNYVYFYLKSNLTPFVRTSIEEYLPQLYRPKPGVLVHG